MDRGTKTVVGIVAIGAFLCCVAGLGLALLSTRLIGRAVITQPDQVARVSNDIADYSLPPGFERKFASDVSGFKLVALGPEQSNSQFLMIVLLQFPAPMSANRAEIENQMRQALAQQTGMGSASLETVGQEQVQIKDQPVEFTIREGTTQDGVKLRQETGIFEGKQGPTLLMVIGETGDWDQPLIDNFFKSIQ